MLTRCYNPRYRQFNDYGGRGIRVCDRWRTSFENFLADVGFRPSPEHSIDRIENDGDYEPGNVTWATRQDQAAHTRRQRYVTFNRDTLTIGGWARRCRISVPALIKRLKRWPLEKALTPLNLEN